MSQEINKTGQKYRILADAQNKIWHVISFVTQAIDVIFNSGKNAETTLGSITGISDSLTSTSSNVAASAAAVKALNDKIADLNSNLGTNFRFFIAPSGSNLGQVFGIGSIRFSNNRFRKMKLSNASNISGVYINGSKQSTNVGEFDVSNYVGQDLILQFRSNVDTNGYIDVELS